MTLVEVIISLGLCIGLLGAALLFAQTMAEVHRDQAQIQVVTENVRGAVEQIARDARLAGAGMVAGAAQNAVTGTPPLLPPIRVVNANPDVLELLLAPGTALATTLSAVLPTDASLPVDALGGPAFAAGDYVLLSDYTNAVLYRLTGSATVTVQGIAGVALGVIAPGAFPVPRFAAGSWVMRASAARYSVQPGTALGMPNGSFLVLEDGAPLGLTSLTSALAENIFDLEIAVGIDGINGRAADGLIDEVGALPNDDEWVFNVAGEVLPAPPFAVRALRITVVGRSMMEGLQPGPGRPAAEDNPGGPPDRYRWRVMREVVMPRNLVMR